MDETKRLVGRGILWPSKLLIFFLIFLGLIVILHIASLATPWWLYAGYRWEDCNTDVSYSWHTMSVTCNDHRECTDGEFDFCQVQINAYDKKNWRLEKDCSNSTNYLECQKLPHIFNGVLAMIILSFLTTVVLLASLALKETRRVPYILAHKKCHLTLIIVANIFSLIGAVVFAAAIPAAYNNANRCSSDPTVGCKFSGSRETKLAPLPTSVTIIWGPGPGWVLEVINMALMLGFFIVYGLRG